MTIFDTLRIIAPLLQLIIIGLLILSITASLRMRKVMNASRVALERTIAIWDDLQAPVEAPDAPDDYEISVARSQGRSAEEMKAEEHAEALAEAPDYDDIDMPHVDYLRMMHAEARERNQAMIADWEARNTEQRTRYERDAEDARILNERDASL